MRSKPCKLIYCSRASSRGAAGLPAWGKVAAIAGVAAFLALVAARYLPFPSFVVALFVLAGLVAVMLHALVAGLLWWLTPERRVPALWAAIVSAAIALGGRAAVKVVLGLGRTAPTIDPAKIALCAVGITGAFAAVGWAAVLLSKRPAPRWGEAAVATACAATGLYSTGPLLLSLGIAANHWTMLSLLALGVVSLGFARVCSGSR